MPTNKPRINITVPQDVNRAIQKLARRDDASVAAKTLDLIKRALEMEEDIALLSLANKREKTLKEKSLLSHEDAWG